MVDPHKTRSDVGPGSYSTNIENKGGQSFNIKTSETFQALMNGAAKNSKKAVGKSPRPLMTSPEYLMTKNLVMNIKAPKITALTSRSSKEPKNE